MALYGSSLRCWDLLQRARFTEAVDGGGVTKLVEADVAVAAVGEGIVLFVVWTQAPPAGSLEYSLGVLAGLLAFLAFHVLLELPLIVNAVRLVRFNTAVLFERVEVGEVVEEVDFRVLQGDSQVLAN